METDARAKPDPDLSDATAAAAEEALRVDPLKLERESRVVLTRFWTKLRDTMARIPFVEDAVAAFFAATDPKTPMKAKAVLMGALAYFIAPVDAIPDFVAFLGYTDDAAVLLLAIKTVQAHLLPDHYARARAWLAAHRTGPVSAEEVAGGPVLDHDAAARPGPDPGSRTAGMG